MELPNWWRRSTLLSGAPVLLLLALPARASIVNHPDPAGSVPAVTREAGRPAVTVFRRPGLPMFGIGTEPEAAFGGRAQVLANPAGGLLGLNAAAPGRGTASDILRFSLPGAGIEVLELAAQPGLRSDYAGIQYQAWEPAEWTPRSEVLVKFRKPAADSHSEAGRAGMSAWLNWLDDLSDTTADARYSPLVLGASGILGIWLARRKRSRPM